MKKLNQEGACLHKLNKPVTGRAGSEAEKQDLFVSRALHNGVMSPRLVVLD